MLHPRGPGSGQKPIITEISIPWRSARSRQLTTKNLVSAVLLDRSTSTSQKALLQRDPINCQKPGLRPLDLLGLTISHRIQYQAHSFLEGKCAAQSSHSVRLQDSCGEACISHLPTLTVLSKRSIAHTFDRKLALVRVLIPTDSPEIRFTCLFPFRVYKSTLFPFTAFSLLVQVRVALRSGATNRQKHQSSIRTSF